MRAFAFFGASALIALAAVLLAGGGEPNPEEAVEAGILTEVVYPEDVLETAITKAREMAAISGPAYAQTKDRLRRGTIQHIRDTLESDVASFGAIPS